MKDRSLSVICQAVDAIFDIFGEDSCPNELFSSLDLLPVLVECKATFNARVCIVGIIVDVVIVFIYSFISVQGGEEASSLPAQFGANGSLQSAKIYYLHEDKKLRTLIINSAFFIQSSFSSCCFLLDLLFSLTEIHGWILIIKCG